MAHSLPVNQFSVRPINPLRPWLSGQVVDSLNWHLSSLQNASNCDPIFTNLIEDNPGYNLIPRQPAHGGPSRDIDLTCYDDIDLELSSINTPVHEIEFNESIDPSERNIDEDFMMEFIEEEAHESG